MNFADMPYGPIREALNTIFGRLGLLLVTLILACMLGCWTAGASLLEGLAGVVILPFVFFASFLFGYGVVCWPLILVFGIAFVRGEWQWRWLLVPLLLAWWTSHDVLHYSMNRSPATTVHKEMTDSIEKTQRELAEQNKKGR